MHILPQLRELERKYREWLVVVGVHSSKFPNEKETANIRHAVLRYGVEHPVVNDREFAVWSLYGVRAWPTLMFIDPAGKVLGKHEGEFQFAQFDSLVAEMSAEFRARGMLNETPLPYQLEAQRAAERPLSFPGKIEADPATGRLFIADSGHHRILVTDREGAVETVIGSGEAGYSDGLFEDSRLNRPQGIAVDGEAIYIADAENHAVRAADLETGVLRTVAGTGEQALFRHAGGDATQFPLNSPYDLVLRDGVLYIAMAGVHQLWAMDLASGQIAPYAGDGVEDIADGPRLEARLAQPYGLASDGGLVYFADSETSAVRNVPPADVDAELASVETLVGDGLFEFGDNDGPFAEAVLQHVQAVAVAGEKLYAADTYNHKIKVLDLEARTVSTLAGDGKNGANDGPTDQASFSEPAGLAILDGVIYVADTNNHAIRAIDIESGLVTTLDITGLPD